jgi:hypothetical protein
MAGTESLSVDTSDSFKPTVVFYIQKHTSFSQTIRIFNLTEKVAGSYGSEKFNEKALKTAKSCKSEDALLNVHRLRWGSHNFTVELAADKSKVADWKGGWTSANKNTILFPEGSRYCSHTVTIQVDSYIKFKERFIVDSVSYIWAVGNIFTMRQFTLKKTIGDETKEVAKYWQPHMQFKQGGLVFVDATEIDEVVAVLTCLAVVRKIRQKYAEYW